ANKPVVIDHELGRDLRVTVPVDDDVGQVIPPGTTTDVVRLVRGQCGRLSGPGIDERRHRAVQSVAKHLVFNAGLDGPQRLSSLEVDADVALVRVFDGVGARLGPGNAG